LDFNAGYLGNSADARQECSHKETSMSVRYFVRYEGQSQDTERFIDYYVGTHGEFMKGYPGIRAAVLHLPVSGWKDPMTIVPGNDFLLAEFKFDSVDALNAALASEARVRAREDAKRFPHFEGKVTHQALTTKVLF
jgi:uncharacterized protein (TIGR02118 family)